MTLRALAKAPTRSRGDPPGSSGKLGDPHILETGQLATRGERLSPKAKASLDARYVGAGGMTNAEIARGHM